MHVVLCIARTKTEMSMMISFLVQVMNHIIELVAPMRRKWKTHTVIISFPQMQFICVFGGNKMKSIIILPILILVFYDPFCLCLENCFVDFGMYLLAGNDITRSKIKGSNKVNLMNSVPIFSNQCIGMF